MEESKEKVGDGKLNFVKPIEYKRIQYEIYMFHLF